MDGSSMVPTPELAIDVTCTRETNGSGAGGEEPVSPVGRLFLEPSMRCYVVCVVGLAAPVDLPALRHGFQPPSCVTRASAASR